MRKLLAAGLLLFGAVLNLAAPAQAQIVWPSPTIPSFLNCPQNTWSDGRGGGGTWTCDRRPTTTAITYYVNGSTSSANCNGSTGQPGSDSNSGLSLATPFKTIAKAVTQIVNVVDWINIGGTIQVCDGTYNESPILQMPLGTTTATTGYFTLQGNLTTPTNVVINGGGAANSWAVRTYNGSQWLVRGMRLTNASTLLWADHYSILYFDQIDFQVSATVTSGALQVSNFAILFTAQTNANTVSATGSPSLPNFTLCNGPGGLLALDFATWTINNTFTVTNGFIGSIQGCFTDTTSATFVNPGNVTGPRFNIAQGSNLTTPSGNGSLTAIPGTTQGITDWNSQYDRGLAGMTVAGLPTCNAVTVGARLHVTDQNTAVSYRGAVTGGGATDQAVYCNGTSWLQD